jgi:peptide/nickel transport system substrate-binding protein
MTTNRLVFLIAACLLLLLPLLPACGGGDDEDSTPIQSPTQTATPMTTPTTMTPAPETTIPAAPAKPEGTLTMAVQAISMQPWIGPFSRGMTTSKAYWAPIYDFLVMDEGQDDYVPSLAKSWEIAPDGMSITFRLREGVQFQDGWGEMTSEDVKFTIEMALNPELGDCQLCRNSFGAIFDRVETAGPYEVTVYLTRARAEDVLGWMCSDHDLALGISSKAYYDAVGVTEANEHLIGSGPYQFVEFTHGNKLVLEALDEHWRTAPAFRTVVIKEVPELTTRVAMIQTGEADIAEVMPEQAVYLEGKGFHIASIPAVNYNSISLLGQWLPEVETYDPELPWLDNKVREAMNLAINREEICQTIFRGYAKPVSMNFYSPWAEALESYPYDPERARQLLAEAGYPDGFDVEMWNINWAGMGEVTDMIFAVQGYWEEIGIDAKITPSNVMAVYGDIVYRKTTGVCLNYNQNRTKAPYGQAPSSWAYSEADIFPMYESAEFDLLVEEYEAAFTLEEKDSVAEKRVQYLYDHYCFVPLVGVDKVWAAGESVGEWQPREWNYLDLEYLTRAELQE